MAQKKADIEGMLNTLASIRQRIPQLAAARAAAPPDDAAEPFKFVVGDEKTMETFEMLALADALESFAGELSASIEEVEQKLMADAMNAYYIAEEMVKDPEHAQLIPYVEQMREIYRRDFGKEIPKKKLN